MKRLLPTFVLGSLGFAAGCPEPKMPSGPPPEYEEPPAPSWLKDAEAPAPATGPRVPALPSEGDGDGGLPSS